MEDLNKTKEDIERQTDAEKFSYIENLSDEDVESLIEEKIAKLEDIDL